MKRLTELLAKHEALGASLEIIHQYLEEARQSLHALPAIQWPRGLAGFDRVSGSPS